MSGFPVQRSIGARVRRLVEAYTPDGTTGRVGLAAVAGPVAVYSLMIAFGFLVNPWIGSLLLVPTAAVVGVSLSVVVAFTLWPVYLSAIGRIDSPETHSRKLGDDPAPSPTERLKSRYQRGELSEEEFERELEAVLAASERPDRGESGARRSSGSSDGGMPEPERSN